MSTYNEYADGFRVDRRPDRGKIEIDLIYPRGNLYNKIEIGLEDVRAADSILIEYDFNRDGWKISQASTFEWSIDDPICDPDWQEVAFIQAWGREKKEKEESR